MDAVTRISDYQILIKFQAITYGIYSQEQKFKQGHDFQKKCSPFMIMWRVSTITWSHRLS